MPEPFSLLLPVWAGDRPDQLTAAFTSSVAQQSRPPAQVVIVRDGPVAPDLETCIGALASSAPVPVDVVRLAANVGLARALTAGLAACRHEIVARMDADDESRADRFELQIPLLEAGADIVGSAIEEFETSTQERGVVRKPPLDPEEIARTARFASPFHHPSVVFRKAAVAAAGGYRDLPLMEDYWLFARMLASGARPANVPEPLVRYRVGAGAYRRRGGPALLRSELRLQWVFRRTGFTSTAQFARNVLIRGGYRLVPHGVRRWGYRAVLLPRLGRK